VAPLIVGDVHGCAHELAELIHQAQQAELILVGDLFSKGPDPLGVWEQIQAHQARSVLGNHDAYLLENWGSPQLPPILQDFCERAPMAKAWLEDLPLFLEESPKSPTGFLVVHAGLHPTLGRGGTTRHMALNLRRFPDTSPTSPFWYDAGWTGPKTAVFGHDARRGLVRREFKGKPIAIGLDSGCVYGGHLSGWIPLEDRVLSLPAKRAYRPV
jgi:hypothetical protein